MPAGARRSLASPVVSGVLCQCGGGGGGGVAAAATSTSGTAGQLTASEAGGGSSLPPSCGLEQERRLQSLFLQLDVNRDGALCIHDLAVGLGRLGLHRSERDLRTLETLLSFVFSYVSAV